MGCFNMRLPHLILAVLVICGITEMAVGKERECDILLRDLKQKKQRLAEYMNAIQKKNEAGTPQLMETLGHKANELIREIRQSEEDIEDCLKNESPGIPQGFDEIKSEEEQYATKNCDELRGMLLPLLRKINQLGRREQSIFSQLSESEKAELMKARQETKNVTAALKARCSNPHSGAGRRLRSHTN